MKIIPVDCNYVEVEFATAYLLVENGKGFFIECNTNYAIPHLMEAARMEGLSPEQIEGLIITHVHLDHAGGAGLFLKECPNAKLYAHPRAARHAVDPSKLIASATEVYGPEFMAKLYGEILPCPADRVVVLEEGDGVAFQGCILKTHHTRGHANHHLVVIEPTTQTLFSGDSFGVSYPKINSKHGLVIIPSTSPTDFDGMAALETIDWISSQDLKQVALTHYGFIPQEQIPESARQLRDQLQFSIELLGRIQKLGLDVDSVTQHILDWNLHYFGSRNVRLDAEDLKLLQIDFKVNAQGLVFAASRLLKK